MIEFLKKTQKKSSLERFSIECLKSKPKLLQQLIRFQKKRKIQTARSAVKHKEPSFDWLRKWRELVFNQSQCLITKIEPIPDYFNPHLSFGILLAQVLWFSLGLEFVVERFSTAFSIVVKLFLAFQQVSNVLR